MQTSTMAPTDRNTHWFSVAAFSTIALVSIIDEFPSGENIKDQEKETKWAVSAVSVALIFSALAVFANLLLKEKFVGTLMEGALAIVTCGFWASVLPALMEPDNNLAATEYAGYIGVGNANLYFFSWGAFIMSFYVLFGYLKRGLELSGNQVFSWAGLAMTSFVVMVTAARQFDSWGCDQDLDSVGCKSTKLAVSVGVISGVVGLAWAFLGRFMEKNSKISKMLDVLVTWFIFVMWIFGIIFINFGVKAAAPEIGNLYFFTWASFALSVSMAMKSLKLLFGVEETEEEVTHGEPVPKEDAPKEAPQEEDTPVVEPNEPDKVDVEEADA